MFLFQNVGNRSYGSNHIRRRRSPSNANNLKFNKNLENRLYGSNHIHRRRSPSNDNRLKFDKNVESGSYASSIRRCRSLSNASSVYDYPQMNSSPINLRKYSRSPTEHREAEAVRTATIIDESKKVPEDNVYCSCDEGY
ncbi:unnamed protein product [Rotaria sp. Silwood1]|nr:unnamed protein product [Rotaria sp. Silwood1]